MNKVSTFLVLGFGLWTVADLRAQDASAQTQTLTVPFKARISGDAVSSAIGDHSNGQATLVFRVFSHQTGGIKVFEERQTVPVQRGVYDARIGDATAGGFPSAVLAALPTVWVEVYSAGALNQASAGRTPVTLRRDPSLVSGDAITLNVDVSLCWTCGGSYPVSSGIIPLPSGSQPYERGSGCGGSLTYMTDTSPRLCSR